MPDAATLAPQLLRTLSEADGCPVALRGRAGSGKTTLLRAVASLAPATPVWCPASEIVDQMAAAIGGGRFDQYSAELSRDRRPLCVEHLEDLRGKARTRHELRRLLEHAAQYRPVVLTLTCAHGDGDVVRWLADWTDLLTLD